MKKELTHVRLAVPLRDRIAKLCDQTGLSQQGLLEMVMADVLDCVDAVEPVGEVQSVSKLRTLLGKTPNQNSVVMEQLQSMQASIAELQSRSVSYSKSKAAKPK